MSGSPPILARLTVAEFASALIAQFEGERLKAYKDGGGVWTIGRGHTGPDVREGMTCTHEQATAWFEHDAAPLFALVKDLDLPVAHAAALVSFGYNCGRSKLEAVLAGHDTIANPVHTTDRHGVVEAGLVSRRRLEELLCLL